MKVLLILLISTLANASFIKKSKVGVCEEINHYGNLSLCESVENEICIDAKGDYSCKFHIVGTEEIDDITKPILETDAVQVCGEDCILAHENESFCSEGKYSVINETFDEIYCEKVIGYEQKQSEDRVLVDAVKKAAYDAEQILVASEKAKIEEGKINMAKCDEALAYLSGNNSGKTEEEVDAMALLFADIYEALKSHRRDKAERLITEKVIDPALEPLRTKLLELLAI